MIGADPVVLAARIHEKRRCRRDQGETVGVGVHHSICLMKRTLPLSRVTGRWRTSGQPHSRCPLLSLLSSGGQWATDAMPPGRARRADLPTLGGSASTSPAARSVSAHTSAGQIDIPIRGSSCAASSQPARSTGRCTSGSGASSHLVARTFPGHSFRRRRVDVVSELGHGHFGRA
jgi:hypothetical protein